MSAASCVSPRVTGLSSSTRCGFLVVIVLFALGAGPEPQRLARIAPGVVWVAALLASLLAMDRLFRDDARDGALEQLMLLPTPLPVVVIAKSDRSLGGDRAAAGRALAAGGAADGTERLCDADANADAAAWHADAELSRRAGRGADGRAAPRRHPVEPDYSAARDPVADFLHRRGGCRRDAVAGRRVFRALRRVFNSKRHANAVRDGGGAAYHYSVGPVSRAIILCEQ
ncbi:heme exporter protein B [Cronobacter sakazakii E899]|nr:heme exporter protein B [Cronobacter sakazakii E899]